MDRIWQLQNAKSHFSELVKRAARGEVQIVTKRGEKTAVLIDYNEYLKLKQQKMNLFELLRGDEVLFDDLPFERSKDMGRSFEFE